MAKAILAGKDAAFDVSVIDGDMCRDREKIIALFLTLKDSLIKQCKVKSIDDVPLEVVKFNVCRFFVYGQAIYESTNKPTNETPKDPSTQSKSNVNINLDTSKKKNISEKWVNKFINIKERNTLTNKAHKDPKKILEKKTNLQIFLKTNKNKKKKNLNKNNIGKIFSIKDGIVIGTGLDKIVQQAKVYFKNKKTSKYIKSIKGDILSGVVLELTKKYVKIVLLGESDKLNAGTQIIYKPKKIPALSIKIDSTMCGTVVDPLGKNLINKKKLTKKAKSKLIEIKAPGIMTRESITEPLFTGIKVIDALLPIGRGQRELIIGDRGLGKTTIALDAILNQSSINNKKNIEVYCIYVAIGQKRTSIQNIHEILIKFHANYYTTIVATTASDTAAVQFFAPYSGCAIAEYFRDSGEDSLIVYDDLSKHAVAYRQLSLLLRRPPGREAFPGDIFYVHSRLLERSAKLNSKFGGGSMTALPIVETQAGDVSGYIPTNVISITDGQIFLEKQLFYQGVRPAVNIGLSVSRVGSAAQTKTMKSIAGNLKLILANYREVANFAQFDTDTDQATRDLLILGENLVKCLIQAPHLLMSHFSIILSILFTIEIAELRNQINQHKFDFLIYNNTILALRYINTIGHHIQNDIQLINGYLAFCVILSNMLRRPHDLSVYRYTILGKTVDQRLISELQRDYAWNFPPPPGQPYILKRGLVMYMGKERSGLDYAGTTPPHPVIKVQICTLPKHLCCGKLCSSICTKVSEYVEIGNITHTDPNKSGSVTMKIQNGYRVQNVEGVYQTNPDGTEMNIVFYNKPYKSSTVPFPKRGDVYVSLTIKTNVEPDYKRFWEHVRDYMQDYVRKNP